MGLASEGGGEVYLLRWRGSTVGLSSGGGGSALSGGSPCRDTVNRLSVRILGYWNAILFMDIFPPHKL